MALLLTLVMTADAAAVTWTADRTITGGGVGWASRGGLAVSSSTLVHTVYEQAAGGAWGVYYRRSTSSGSSFGTPVTLSSLSIGQAGGASVEANGSTVHALWLEGDRLFAGTDTAVVYRRSVDGGLTWAAPVRLSPSSESAGTPRIAVRGSVVVTTWTNQLNGRIYVRASSDGGATWKARTQPASTTRRSLLLYEGYPNVAVGTGVVHLAWYGSPKVLKVRRSTNAGATWKTAQVLAKNGTGYQPAVAASGSTAVVGYAATGSSGAWTVIRRSTNAGSTWSGVVSLSAASTYPSFSPVITVRGGRWLLAFERCRSNGCKASDVYLRSSTNGGRTWSAASRASVKKRAYGEPADVDVATKVLVLYDDYNSSTSDVFLRQGS